MRKLKCLFKGHAWRLHEDHNLDTGLLQVIEVRCDHCGATSGRHRPRPELTNDELLAQRKFFTAMRDAFVSLNDSVKP
jgi:hypothetical protein